jgi:serine/threonine protein kinase
VSWAQPDKLRDLFAAASDLEPAEQVRFLDRECAGQAELRSALEDLLRADKGAESNTLWQRPALQSEARRTAANHKIPFDRLGPYRILERIGAGGMGVVYLAEGDYDGVLKRVAIKAIPYVFDDEMVRRFQQERRILASLEHPNIARMLDAGTTPDGVPYLVMEYVDGMPLNRYADQHRLSVNARLNLFRPICEAIAYAHRNLVVHRDLKPGNILVTADGVPKLLDFGIARLIGESRPDATVTGLMTPRYASPEQLAGQPITTASDIYSLGVILEELVSGREQEKGDLENVVSMALRKEPERRYASAADLAEDVRRVVERYPVRARPDTWGYRLRRLVSRRPVEVAVMIALTAAVLIAGVVALDQYRQANHRFQDVRDVANSFLFEVYDAIGDQPGTTKARAIIAARAQQYLDALARDRWSDVGLRRELATAYRKLGDILGAPFAPNLGDTDGALRNYQKAAAILEPIAAQKQDAAQFTELGLIYAREGQIASRKGSLDGAIAAGEKSVRARERAVTLDRSSLETRRALVDGRLFLGICYGDAGKARIDVAALQTAETLNSSALTEARQLSAESPTNELLRRLVFKASQYAAYSESDLADHTGDRAYTARALQLYQEELTSIQPLHEANPARYLRPWADALADLSRGWLAAGDGPRSEQAAREGLLVFEEIAAGDPNNYEASRDVFVAHWNLARALAAQNRDASAEFEAVLTGFEQAQQRNPEDRAVGVVAESRDWLAAHALAAGKRAGAVAQYRKNIAMIGNGASAAEIGTLALEDEKLGDALAPADKAKAADCYRRSLELWRKLEASHQVPPKYAGQETELQRKMR